MLKQILESLRYPEGPSRELKNKAWQKVHAQEKKFQKELEMFLHDLSKVVKEESIPRWMNKENDFFEGMKPIDYAREFGFKRLGDMVLEMSHGLLG